MEQGKKTGRLKVYACSITMSFLIEGYDLLKYVDGIMAICVIRETKSRSENGSGEMKKYVREYVDLSRPLKLNALLVKSDLFYWRFNT